MNYLAEKKFPKIISSKNYTVQFKEKQQQTVFLQMAMLIFRPSASFGDHKKWTTQICGIRLSVMLYVLYTVVLLSNFSFTCTQTCADSW